MFATSVTNNNNLGTHYKYHWISAFFSVSLFFHFFYRDHPVGGGNVSHNTQLVPLNVKNHANKCFYSNVNIFVNNL